MAAFREDATILEAQHVRWQEKPDFPMVNLPFDEAPAKMIRVLDRLLREKAAERDPNASACEGPGSVTIAIDAPAPPAGGGTSYTARPLPK